MQPALFDSSIYITALRQGDNATLALRRLAADAPLWLSAVVLEELYAGATERDRHVVERLERDFDRIKRILAIMETRNLMNEESQRLEAIKKQIPIFADIA